MLKLIKRLLTDSTLYISIGLAVLILVLSLIPLSQTGTLENLDKIEHAFAYSVLTFSWLFTQKYHFKKRAKIAIILGCFFFGIVIEILQATLTTYRSASLLDIVANSLGIVTAFGLFNWLEKKNQFI